MVGSGVSGETDFNKDMFNLSYPQYLNGSYVWSEARFDLQFITIIAKPGW